MASHVDAEHTGRLSISVETQDDIVAPAPIFARVTEVLGLAGHLYSGHEYRGDFHEYTFIWQITGQPLSPYKAVEELIPPNWNNANKAYGPHVGFCLTDAGTYTIECLAVDRNGDTAFASTKIVTVAPAERFLAEDTIVFAVDGDFSGAPDAAHKVSMVKDLERLIQKRKNATRVSFKGGELVYDFAVNVRGGRLTHVDTWDGREVILIGDLQGRHLFRFVGDSGERQITFSGIHFRGNWDATEELGIENSAFSFNLMTRIENPIIVLHRCHVSGAENLFLMQNQKIMGAARVMISDCKISNWRGYGAFVSMPRGRFYCIGTSICQDPDALNGGQKNGLYNYNAGVRLASIMDHYFGATRIFNTTGWFGAERNCNPCIRFTTTPQTGDTGVLDRVVCEGGGQGILRATAQTKNEVDHAANFVWDKVILLAHARAYKALVVSHRAPITCRNIYGFVPRINSYSRRLAHMFSFTPDNASTTLWNEPIRIFGCSLVDLSDRSHNSRMRLTEIDAEFTNVTIENNSIFPSDNHSTLPGVDEFKESLSEVNLMYLGVRYNYGHIVAEPGIVKAGASFRVSYPNTKPHPTAGKYSELGSTVPTDQSYWKEFEFIDKRHRIVVNGRVFLAERNDFSVEFESSWITITNLSSVDWNERERRAFIRLDRASRRKIELPLDDEFAPEIRSVSVPILTSDSNPVEHDIGLFPYDDLLETVRTNVRKMPGAMQF